MFLIDGYESAANETRLQRSVTQLDSIDAFLAEDPKRDVVVHRHGGRSRTGLVLKARAMRRDGWRESRAHERLTAVRPKAHRENSVFVELLAQAWLSSIGA